MGIFISSTIILKTNRWNNVQIPDNEPFEKYRQRHKGVSVCFKEKTVDEYIALKQAMNDSQSTNPIQSSEPNSGNDSIEIRGVRIASSLSVFIKSDEDNAPIIAGN